MKKVITAALVLLLVIVGGMILALSMPQGLDKTPEDSSSGKDKQSSWHKIRVQVIDYLEDKALDTNFGGQVFADYYEFGREDGELFLWAYVVEYYQKNGQLQMGSGHSGPMVITFSDKGSIKGHWQPRDGKNYARDIKDKFPEQCQSDILEFQTRHRETLQDLKESTRSRAEKRMSPPEQPDIRLPVGGTDVIELEANRTTGYKWIYSIDNRDIIKVVSDEYREKEIEKGVVGAGGTRVLRIKGTQAGSADIRFQYVRPWESGERQEPKKVRTFRIKVEGDRAGLEKPELDTEYISLRDWDVHIVDSAGEKPPHPIRLDPQGEVECADEYSRQESEDWTYCLKESSEGAAGTIYKEYAYTTIKDHRIITVSFTLAQPQCGNYGEAERAACQEEYKNFEQQELADQVIAELDF